jgi:hypothetical protein
MYELYRARYRILEWRDDSVYKTEFVDTGWFGEDEIEANKPRETNILFVTSNDTEPLVHIRRRR